MRYVAYFSWFFCLNTQTYDEGNSEILSTCPNCDSILAVIPSKLTTDDICPNCGSKLVTMS